MPDPTAETGPPVPDDPAPVPHVGGREETPDSEVATRPAPTVAEQAASTPAPHAPERVTNSDSTEVVARWRVAETRPLPPIPGYDVQEFIGRGGMGVIYRAVHLATRRTVALKLVNPSGARDPVALERFEREVQALAALKHPNIVPIFDAGDWHGFPYCAMEFVPGGALNRHLDRLRADLRGAVLIVAKTARAVAAMHAAGVLHRDLKPMNILLGANNEPMVADFGLVRWPDDGSDLTNSGSPVGTRQYMAPEQTLGRRADYTRACDIWALGVTLFEVLTGQRPFRDDGETDLFTRIRFEAPPSLAALAPNVPAEIEAVVRKCLEKRPEDRYESAAAMAADLEGWLAGKPVTAAPVPPVEPLTEPSAAVAPRKKSRRALPLLALAGVVLLAFFGTRLERAPAEPVKKMMAERVADGERVKLTDEWGIPMVPLSPVEGYELGEKAIGDYHGFSCLTRGLVGLADEPWKGPIRIEADVAVRFSTDRLATGGVYFARRVCAGSDLHHETFLWCGVRPRLDGKNRTMSCAFGHYWWPNNQLGTNFGHDEKPRPWSPDGTVTDLRFAHVVAEVREKEVRTTVDGVPLKPLPEAAFVAALNNSRRRNQTHMFTAPAFGTGIGVFCETAECIVANLTVSKLDP